MTIRDVYMKQDGCDTFHARLSHRSAGAGGAASHDDTKTDPSQHHHNRRYILKHTKKDVLPTVGPC